MFSSMDFCRKTVKAGATEFALAIHGYCAEQHDSLTRSPGSFSQTSAGIKNLISLGCLVLTNTVVVKQNYKDVPKIAEMLINLGVGQFQFAFVHPMGNAWKNFDKVVPKISEAAPYIHQGLQIAADSGKFGMAEAMPFCLMKGYTNFIAEKMIPDTEIKGLKTQNTENFTEVRKVYGKKKFSQCRTCKYNNFCEGPWREYPEKMGDNEFKAVKKD
jgi:radical SAM protein with 4Fe4S-binding SPASM domain